MNPAPIREQVGEGWTQEWIRWFAQAINCVSWNKSMTTRATINFGSVAANSQLASSAIAMAGARPGDTVLVTPSADTSGIDYKARVSADDQVTVYAINFTIGAIDPASMTFRIIVLQN